VERKRVAKEVPELVAEDIDKLRVIFPYVFVEGKIDFEKLRQSLGQFLDDRPDKYAFNWAGKRNAINVLQMPTRATLAPAESESVNFDTTENLFIEGDNLEVLKLLYKPYFGKVKMIYIDPPYNTGNDFIYQDNYADPLDTYLGITGQKDTQENLLTSNPETSGRYHSAWLSMIYPRLFLAKQLLGDDGAIAVSIDDHEIHNLRLIMNEIFGEENLVNVLIVRRRIKSLNIQFKQIKSLNQAFEYVLIYRKSESFSYANPFKEAGEERQTGYWNSFWNNADRPTMRYDIDGIKITRDNGNGKRREALEL
jgi:adenine-specific DNA-methyltransferase